ncbi:MAG TPA: hypothetical protein PK322_10690 [Opitutaceae bacterium]|nr:hypothetical protein [Opitutaceae bacterium]
MRNPPTASLPSRHPAPLPPSGEETLALADRNRWLRACGWAAKDERLVPGCTEVTERCDGIPTTGLLHSRYAFRTIPDRLGRPRAHRIRLANEARAQPTDPLTLEVRKLLDRLDAAVDAAAPLHAHAGSGIRRLAHADYQGHRCVLLGLERSTADLAFEFRLWIDARHGYARHVDYRARGLPAPPAGIATAAAKGSRTYRLDESDRWLLVEQSEHLTFWSVASGLPTRGFAERTSTHSDHWQSGTAGRAGGAPRGHLPGQRPACVLPVPARSGTSAPVA